MIRIRPATEADRGQILERMEEVYGPSAARRAERLWHWQWHLDPRLPRPGYRGVVAEWRGRVIANLATLPTGLHIGGREVEAWWLADVLVHRGLTRQALRAERTGAGSARRPELARGLAAALFDDPTAGPVQLGKHVSDDMATIAARVGFNPIPGSGGRTRRLSLRHPLGRLMGRPLGDVVGALIDPLLGPRPRARLAVVDHQGPFDERFDTLWKSVRAAYPALCRRDARVLDWRYHRHPDRDHRVLTLSDAGHLRGYCVVRAYHLGKRRRGKILDLLTAPSDRPGREALLAAALEALREQRAERVECFACGLDLTPLLARLGFSEKISRSGRPGPLMARHLPDAAAGLYVTQGDGDGG